MPESDLTTPLTLRSGVVLPNRIAMAPMVAQGADEATGHITNEDIAYFARRSTVAGAIITGAAFVARSGRGFGRQISIADDQDVEGLAGLARTMRRDGARAFVQLYHGGREAYPVADELGRVLAPSTKAFDWLPYVPQEMTLDEIAATIAAFGAATRRAIAAGFDGVEIHGANHYLLQQFFSAYSNRRTDEWGGDLERRMAFPLAIVDEVQRVAAGAPRPFAVGYRVCPDEIHGANVGYTVAEASQLIDRIAGKGVDYIHVSIFNGYDAAPIGARMSYGQIVRTVVAGRCPVMIVSDVFTECDAVRALEHGDIVAIGRAALVEPQFAAKIAAGHGEEIETTVKGRFTELDLPAGLIDWYTGDGRGVLPPMPGIDEYIK
jgi:2,4-dienoyl-CoA reductase-like NADH-dependent reductase (Old Yellow Enzyme family)